MSAAQPSAAAANAERERRRHEKDVGGDETVSEQLAKDVFSTYVCRSLPPHVGKEHPGDISEAASISAICLPPAEYPLFDSIPEEVVASGKLSRLQLEGVLYACQKHLTFLPNGDRAGFFIGDGAGVGKGRQISGIIFDNYARGRRKHVWFSTSSDLRLDAERDLADLGCHINVINNMQTLDKETKALGMSKDVQDGVLFVTYSTLVGASKGKSRLQQLLEWAGGPTFDGCIVFDECHKAKNFVPGKEGASTKVSAMVIDLQKALPRARVVYCSATGVSEVGNMAYMDRIGLWGEGTSFKDFEEFVDSMKKRGLGFLEMLAMELKAEGRYVARGLSFRQAEFTELEADLGAEGTAVYDAAVEFWSALRIALIKALELTRTESKEVWKPFWALQQRFFKLLCVSLKVPRVVEEAQAALAAGQCVVIGLQSTGEAAADALNLQPGTVVPGGNFISTTREMLLRFVQVHFPIHMATPGGGAGAAPVAFEDLPLMEQASLLARGGTADAVFQPLAKDEVGPVDPECEALRDSLLEQAQDLCLPPNFLDDIIDRFGGPDAVAEMTGRKGRVVADARGRPTYQLRAKPDSNEMDSLNVNEARAFMKGSKVVAIVSDAASTGISLHADRRAENQRRRVHITIELPWSADKAIQQLGRSHRSNQTTAPLYKLISTPIGGEQRFAAAVAKRLQSLGALTRGDRRAASGIEISSKNLDSPLGRKALKRMYDAIVSTSDHLAAGVAMDEIVYGEGAGTGFKEGERKDSLRLTPAQMHATLRSCVTLMGVGVGASEAVSVDAFGDAAEKQAKDAAKDLGDVKRFLNRILGLEVGRQNLLFNYFFAVMQAEVRAAKSEGKYSEGVSDLPCSKIKRAHDPVLMWSCDRRRLKTFQHDLAMDRGVSFEQAKARLQHEKAGEWDSFYKSRRQMYGRPMLLLAFQKPGQKGVFTFMRPNTGQSYFDMDRDELLEKYTRISPEDAEASWDELFELSYSNCMHGPNCAMARSCQVGRRLTVCSVLAGAIVPIWGVLERVLERHSGALNKSDRSMRVVRVELDGGERIVGVRYPQQLIHIAKAMLENMQQEEALTAWIMTTYAMSAGMARVAAVESIKQQMQGAAVLGESRPLAGLPPGFVAQQQAGAWGSTPVEEITPVDSKALARAVRPKQTMMSFFSKVPKAAATAGGPASKKRPPAPSSAAPAPKKEKGASAKGKGGAVKGENAGAKGFFGAKTVPPKASQSVLAAKNKPPKQESPRGVLGAAGGGDGDGLSGQLLSMDPPAAASPLKADARRKSVESSGGGGGSGQEGPPPGGQEGLDTLMAMGFDRAVASKALVATEGNVDRSVGWILQK